MAATAAKNSELMTVQEVAAFLRVHPNSVERWLSEGWLPEPIRLGPKGRWLRWRRSAVEEFLAKLEGENAPSSR